MFGGVATPRNPSPRRGREGSSPGRREGGRRCRSGRGPGGRCPTCPQRRQRPSRWRNSPGLCRWSGQRSRCSNRWRGSGLQQRRWKSRVLGMPAGASELLGLTAERSVVAAADRDMVHRRHSGVPLAHLAAAAEQLYANADRRHGGRVLVWHLVGGVAAAAEVLGHACDVARDALEA